MSDGAASLAPLRILHVVEAFGGGVAQMTKTLAENLAERGDTVAIAYGRRPETPSAVRSFVSASVELHQMPWKRRSAREQLEAVRELRALAREWQPDVVHLHSSFAGITGAIAFGGSVPSVYTPHGYSFTMLDQNRQRQFAFRMIERFTARRVDLVGAVSSAEAEAARSIVTPNKVVVVRNGIPELDQPEPPRNPSGDKPLVVTVGRIDEARMPAAAAGILAAVSDLAEVLWVGGGGRGGVPVSTVTSRGVPVTGWIEHDQVLSLLRSATICLHWTAWDGQPLSILEAMANDAVVVARDIAATREILDPSQVIGSEEEAVRLLRRLLTHPALRIQMLEFQHRRRSRFGAKRMADEWRKVYCQLSVVK